jgi:hypothetical protein
MGDQIWLLYFGVAIIVPTHWKPTTRGCEQWETAKAPLSPKTLVKLKLANTN